MALILAVASVGTWQWGQAISPTFTTDEIAAAYHSLPSTAGPVAWDATTVSVENSGQDDHPAPNEKASPCYEIYSPRLPPVSAGRVSIELEPVGRRDGGRRWSGSAITFSYQDPDRAREKFRLINDALRQCQDSGTGGTPIQIYSLTSGHETWSRSVTRFTVGLAWSRSDLGVNLIRFGNTVTWVVQGDGAGVAKRDAVTDVVMGQLQASHRAR
jgi:hypothetical protein